MIALPSFSSNKTKRERRRATAIIASSIIAIAFITSCGVLSGSSDNSTASAEAPQRNVDGISPENQPAANRISEISDKMESLLSSLSMDIESLDRNAFRDAIVGLDPETASTVEVSIFRTPTGLDVEAVQGAVQVDGTCIFGELRKSGVSMSLLPVLSNGRCFIGDQR